MWHLPSPEPGHSLCGSCASLVCVLFAELHDFNSNETGTIGIPLGTHLVHHWS